MCELAWVSDNQGSYRLMNIATFSPQDLWEQGCKSYVASYHVSEELVIPQMVLANYVDKGDSRKFSSADDSQYTGNCYA